MARSSPHAERVTVTMPSELVARIDRIERNRSRSIAEAVRHELQLTAGSRTVPGSPAGVRDRQGRRAHARIGAARGKPSLNGSPEPAASLTKPRSSEEGQAV